MSIKTPYYLIDEKLLLKNLEKIKYLREKSGAKSLLALKCYSTWATFPLMAKYMDGTTSSSYNEAKLGYEEFGKETHAFSVGYNDDDITKMSEFCDKIIFNSASQFKRYYEKCSHLKCGLRVNPKISYSGFDLADPARKFSRLGVSDYASVKELIDKIDGFMFHYNCENDKIDIIEEMIETISLQFNDLLHQVNWVSFGGGIEFTKDGFDLDRYANILKNFSENFGVQVYLEPGEASITGSTSLITSVVDIVENEKKIAIVDSSIEAHMLDLLIYRENAKITSNGQNTYQIAGCSCLAGDIFCEANFENPLQVGDKIIINDAGGYTMVKKNWFNGVRMPSIVVKRVDGEVEKIKEFNYNDFKNGLS